MPIPFVIGMSIVRCHFVSCCWTLRLGRAGTMLCLHLLNTQCGAQRVEMLGIG